MYSMCINKATRIFKGKRVSDAPKYKNVTLDSWQTASN